MYRNDVKKVRFFRDGDANFSGVSVAVSRTRYRNFDSLLSDLSQKVPLPFGVRTLHTPGGVHHVHNIDEIEDGKDYVCSTFHSRPIKKLNYTRQTNRASWRPTRRKVENQSKTEKQDNDGGEKLFQTRNLKPKSITVIAKDDSSNRARIILNRKTAMNYESVLQTISDILQMNNGPVKDLYTVEGKKVGGMADLIHGPDVFVASGRSSGTISARSLPSRILKKKSNSDSFNSEKVQSKSAAVQNRKQKRSFSKKSPYTQPIFSKKKEAKPKGNSFIFTVITSEAEDAVTQGPVSVVVCGSKGSTGQLTLGPPSCGMFAKGSREEFEINIGNIGKVKKLRVMHTPNEDDQGWLLNEILLTSMSRSSEEYSFQCNQWFSNKEKGDVSIAEFPAIFKGKPTAQVVNYEVVVMTGNFKSSATDSKVFIQIFGENGETGKRWLNSSNKPNDELFAKGSTDIFDIQAVDLQKINKILIGHDNSGDSPGWYLEKVVIKDTAKESEYSFPCRRYLDENEEDGKTELTINAISVYDPSVDSEQLWQRNAWKFKDSNEIILISAVSGDVLTIDEDGKVFAEDVDSSNCIFTISGGGESKSRILTVQTEECNFNITLDSGSVTGRKGNPGLLSEFFIIPSDDNCIALESVVHRGTFIALDEAGAAKPISVDCEQTRFNVHVKGYMRNLGRIKFKQFSKSEIIIENNGALYGDGERDDERGEFVVHKTGIGTRSFQSAITDKFISVGTDGINCKGEEKESSECQFKIHKDKQKGIVRLESVKMPGVFLGIGETGRISHAVDAGDLTASFLVEVASFGEKDERKFSVAEDNYSDNDDFEDNEEMSSGMSSGRESSASDASRHSVQYDDDDDQERRPSSADHASRGSSIADSRSSKSVSLLGSAASSRGASAAGSRQSRATASRKNSAISSASRASSAVSRQSNVDDEKGETDEIGNEMPRSASVVSRLDSSRPGTHKSGSIRSDLNDDGDFEKEVNGEEKEDAEMSRPESPSSEKEDGSRPGTGRSASQKSHRNDEDEDDDEDDDDHDDENDDGSDLDGEKKEDDDLSRPASPSGEKDGSKAGTATDSPRPSDQTNDERENEDVNREKESGKEEDQEVLSRPGTSISKAPRESEENKDHEKEEERDKEGNSEERPVSSVSQGSQSRPLSVNREGSQDSESLIAPNKQEEDDKAAGDDDDGNKEGGGDKDGEEDTNRSDSALEKQSLSRKGSAQEPSRTVENDNVYDSSEPRSVSRKSEDGASRPASPKLTEKDEKQTEGNADEEPSKDQHDEGDDVEKADENEDESGEKEAKKEESSNENDVASDDRIDKDSKEYEDDRLIENNGAEKEDGRNVTGNESSEDQDKRKDSNDTETSRGGGEGNGGIEKGQELKEEDGDSHSNGVNEEAENTDAREENIDENDVKEEVEKGKENAEEESSRVNENDDSKETSKEGPGSSAVDSNYDGKEKENDKEGGDDVVGQTSREGSTVCKNDDLKESGSRPASQKSNAAVSEGLAQTQPAPVSRDGSPSSLHRMSSRDSTTHSGKENEEKETEKIVSGEAENSQDPENTPSSETPIDVGAENSLQESHVDEDGKEKDEESDVSKPGEKEVQVSDDDKEKADDGDKLGEEKGTETLVAGEKSKGVDEEEEKNNETAGSEEAKKDEIIEDTGKNDNSNVKEDDDENRITEEKGNEEKEEGSKNDEEKRAIKEDTQGEKAEEDAEKTENEQLEKEGKDGIKAEVAEKEANEDEDENDDKEDGEANEIKEEHESPDQKEEGNDRSGAVDENVTEDNIAGEDGEMNSEETENTSSDRQSSTNENEISKQDGNEENDKNDTNESVREEVEKGEKNGSEREKEEGTSAEVEEKNDEESEVKAEEEKVKDNEEKSNEDEKSDEAEKANEKDEINDEESKQEKIGNEGKNEETSEDASDSKEFGVSSPIISPTPPKTPRNSSSTRRPSSRLTTQSASRSGSRASVTSPSKTEDSQIHASDAGGKSSENEANAQHGKEADDEGRAKDEDERIGNEKEGDDKVVEGSAEHAVANAAQEEQDESKNANEDGKKAKDDEEPGEKEGKEVAASAE